ncbi:glycosyltransferase [Methylotuvimicrobium buryatense]|nr:glycosyltransferase [Methylotuvimicrobium buryatense]
MSTTDNKPFISILMPTYNHGAYIKKAIESVLSCDSVEIELIIGNNCSEDNTDAVIEPYLSDNRVVYFRNEENIGMGANGFKCISLAKGVFSLLLASDDYLYPGFIELIYLGFLKNKNIDVFYSNVNYVNEKGKLTSINKHPGLVDFSYTGLRNEFATIISSGVHIKIGACAIKTGFLKDYIKDFSVSSFPDGFVGYDTDILLFLSQNGACFSYTNTIHAVHRKHENQSSGQFQYHKGQHLIDNLFLWEKYITNKNLHRLSGFEEKILNFIEFNIALLKKNASNPEKILSELGCRIDAVKSKIIKSSNRLRPLSAKPLVTVVMPTKNRPELLQYALKSIIEQVYDNWQAIVINDGGCDVGPLVEAIDQGRNKIHYIHLPSSKGHAAARNVGLELAQGEIITYLDDDDMYFPNHLEIVVNALINSSDPVVFTQGEWVSETIENGERIDIKKEYPYINSEHSLDKLLVKNYIGLIFLAHRKSCLIKIRGFDESLTALVDWDLILSLSMHFKIRRLDDITVQARSRNNVKDNVSRNERKNFFDLFSRIYKKYPVDDPAIQAQRNSLLEYFQKEQSRSGNQASGPITINYKQNKADQPKPADLYKQWLQERQITEADAQLFAERMLRDWRLQPIIHILVEVAPGEEQGLADTIDSLSQQLYGEWRLVILAPFPAPDSSFDEIDIVSWHVVNDSASRQNTLNALLSDDERVWFWRLPAGTQWEVQALLCLGDYINLYPQARLFYCDDDERGSTGGYQNPRFKPDVNIDYLYSYNYLGACAISAQALKVLGGWHTDGEAQSYDFALHVLDQCGEAALAHIPEVLIHLPPNKIQSLTESLHRQALMEHFKRRNIEVDIQEGYLPNTFNIVYRWPQTPLVSIIIPTRDRLDLLKPCVESLLDKTQYPNYEVLVVDNQSEKSETLEYFQKLEQEYNHVRVIKYAKPYNYSAINNAAAEQANGDYLVLLNNDTVIIQEQWLERLLNHGLRDEVGIVGARLVFPNQTLQHAGVILGMGPFGVADHPHISLPLTDPGYMNRAQVVQNFSAVTAACLLIRKSIYFDVGGLDAENFKVLFNDVDLCLKVRERGYKIVWTPYVTEVHHGSSSIKADRNPDNVKRARQEADGMVKKWLPQLANDPAYNRNLSLKHRHFQIETETDVTWNPDFHDRLRVYAFPGNDTGIGEYRVRAPLRVLTNAAMIQSSLLPNHSETLIPDIVEIERVKPDVMMLQNGFADYLINAWTQYKRFNNVFQIFSQDDLIHMLPKKHPLQGKWPKDLRKRLRKLLEQSDRLIVATEPLKEEYGKYSQDVRLVPNYLEKARWLGLDIKFTEQRDGKPRVGWAGGGQHQGDLELILPVVEATANEIDWVFMGMCPDMLRPFSKEFHSGVLFDQYPAKLASLDLDLAIAPLEYNNFNMAKTNLRLLEYGILGWPVVCSDVYPYQNAPVTRVGHNASYWIKTVREKLAEPDALRAEGLALQQWVLVNFMLEDHLDEWFSALTP